jgi:hypothetical protein
MRSIAPLQQENIAMAKTRQLNDQFLSGNTGSLRRSFANMVDGSF